MNVFKKTWSAFTFWFAGLFLKREPKKIISNLTAADIQVINDTKQAQLMLEVKKLNSLLAGLYGEQKTIKDVLLMQNEALTTLTTNQEILVHSLSELKLIPSDYDDEFLEQSAEETVSSHSGSSLSDDEKKRLN